MGKGVDVSSLVNTEMFLLFFHLRYAHSVVSQGPGVAVSPFVDLFWIIAFENMCNVISVCHLQLFINFVKFR